MTPTARTGAQIIAVGGGKGGVGKSVVAGNLAIALARRGARTVLVDADLGAANQHTLFGVDRPGPGIQALLEHEVSSLREALTPTRLPELSLVVGSGPIPGAANINHGQKTRLLRQIRNLDADFVVVDVGAGTSHNVIDFFDLGDVRLVVVTPQLTSIQNAYGFLKAAVFRLFRRAAETPDEVAHLDAAMTSRETERADRTLARLDELDPKLAMRLRDELRRFDARLLGNQVMDAQEAGVFQGVTRMVRDFLDVSLLPLGYLSSSRAIHDSINRRQPRLFDESEDENTRVLHRIAETLLMDRAAGLSTLRGLAGAPLVSGEAPPVDEDLSGALRGPPRLQVGWNASLEREGVRIAARVLDVAPGGVAVETRHPLVGGEHWMLVLNEPGLMVKVLTVVRHGGPSASRAGLVFERRDESSDQIVEAARLHASRRI